MFRLIHVLWFTFRLRSGNPEARRSAAFELCRDRMRSGWSGWAVAPLCKAANDTDVVVRCLAIEALRKSRNPRAIPCLVQILAQDGENDSWDTWKAAARALGAFRAVEAIDPIVKLFSRTLGIGHDVFETALDVVGEIGDGRGALITLHALSYRRGELPDRIRKFLGQIGAAAIEPLRLEFLKRRTPGIAAELATLGWKPTTQEERILWGLALPQYEMLVAEGAAAVEPMRNWFTTQGTEEALLLLPHFGELPAEAVGPVLVELLATVDGRNKAHPSAYSFEREVKGLIELVGRKQVAEGVPVLIDILCRPELREKMASPIIEALTRIGAASSAPVQEALLARRIAPKEGLAVLRQVGAVSAEPGLVSLMGNPDPEVRRLARETLEKLSWRAATPDEVALVHISRGQWVEALGVGVDVEPMLLEALRYARLHAHEPALFQAAALTRDPAVVEPLFNCLTDGKAPWVEAATGALVQLGTVALPGLLTRLDRKNVAYAALAAAVLGKIGSPAIPELVKRLSDPARCGLVSQALHAMRRAADSPEQAVEIAIGRGDLEAAGALGAVAVEPLLKLWLDPEAPHEAIVRALGRAGGEAAVAHLVGVLHKWPMNTGVWGAAWMSLGQLGESRAFPALINLLIHNLNDNDCDPVRRAAAASALADLGDRRAVEPLLRMLTQDSGNSPEHWKHDCACREVAAANLGRFGDMSVIEPLLKAINYWKKGPIYEAALASFRALGEDALPALLPWMRNESSDLSLAAVLVMGQFPLQRVQTPLLEALVQQGPRQRWRQPLQRVQTPLLEAFQGSRDVRAMAAAVLAQLGWKPGDDVERVWLAIVEAKFDVAAKLGAPAVGPLVEEIATRESRGFDMLEDMQPKWDPVDEITIFQSRGAGAASAALWAMRGPDVFAALRDLLTTHPMPRMRTAAVDAFAICAVVDALAKCGDPRVVETLLAELDRAGADRMVQNRIMWRLGELGDQRAFPSLLARLDSDLRTSRSTAVAALARIGDVRAVPALVDLWHDNVFSAPLVNALLVFARIDPAAVPLDILKSLANYGDKTETLPDVKEYEWETNPMTGEMVSGGQLHISRGRERVVVDRSGIRNIAEEAIARRG